VEEWHGCYEVAESLASKEKAAPEGAAFILHRVVESGGNSRPNAVEDGPTMGDRGRRATAVGGMRRLRDIRGSGNLDTVLGGELFEFRMENEVEDTLGLNLADASLDEGLEGDRSLVVSVLKALNEALALLFVPSRSIDHVGQTNLLVAKVADVGLLVGVVRYDLLHLRRSDEVGSASAASGLVEKVAIRVDGGSHTSDDEGRGDGEDCDGRSTSVAVHVVFPFALEEDIPLHAF